MADKGFNGSTLKFPDTSSTVGSLLDLTYGEGGAVVDVGDSADSNVYKVAGRKEISLQATVKGASTLARGTTGSVTIAWFDGGSESVTKMFLSEFEQSGAMDDAITTTLTFEESE